MASRALRALLAAAILAPTVAAGEEQPPGWWILGEAGVGPAARVEASRADLGPVFGSRAMLLRRGLALAASVEGGTSLSGKDSWEVMALGGVGISRAPSPRLRLYALAVAGLHDIEVDERGGPGWDSHPLPAAGVRMGFAARTRGAIFLSLGVSATVLADLGRDRDFFLRRDVGGVTAFLSLTVGLGLAGPMEGVAPDPASPDPASSGPDPE